MGGPKELAQSVGPGALQGSCCKNGGQPRGGHRDRDTICISQEASRGPGDLIDVKNERKK